jgi:hypothetical protein
MTANYLLKRQLDDMKEDLIQRLHPKADKIKKKILLKNYHFIKDYLLTILSETELTHT